MREMRNQRSLNWEMENPQVAVAIDKDKSSQNALKWTLENLVTKGQTLLLLHVKHKNSHHLSNEAYAKDVFLPFRCFCTRKDVQCKDVILDDGDIAKGIVEFVAQNAVEKLVVGSASRSGFARFKTVDVPSSISKGAPDFCTVYVISKGRVSSQRNAVRPAPTVAHFRSQTQSQASLRPDHSNSPPTYSGKSESSSMGTHSFEEESIVSPFTRAGGARSSVKSYGEILTDTDISFVSSGRPSTDKMFPSLYFEMDGNQQPTFSNSMDNYDMMRMPIKHIMDAQMMANDDDYSQESGQYSWSSQPTDDSEAEMRRLKLQLKQTMEAYNTACKEALTSHQKAKDLHHWKIEKKHRIEEAKMKEETALAIAEMEKDKCRAAVEAAEASKRIAELEAQKRMHAESYARKEADEKRKALDALAKNDVRYRRYTIEEIEVATDYFVDDRKVGEGGYGPVYRSYLDHTQVAIKVLRPDAAQGRSQFQQEVEVLSRLRHPNMVLLLGACPEYGCLVYEYMANGSLEDRLLRRGDTPVLPWQLRFRIAAEISTGLLFLHQTKPEPLVHRDLKPANILLDHNYVSKISDVGLARLVPPNVADEVTQYRMTSAAGTFCYIDPEYQQTGMLGIKSDVYSLGIMLLQIVTGKPPMGLTHFVERSIEKGTIEEMLDPQVEDWPIPEALRFAKIALQCAELRRKDRPDLGKEVLPEMNRLRALADENMYYGILGGGGSNDPSPVHSVASQDVISDTLLTQSETESTKSRSSISSFPGRRITE